LQPRLDCPFFLFRVPDGGKNSVHGRRIQSVASEEEEPVTTPIIVIVVVIALLLLYAIIVSVGREQRRRHLREHFGTEYDRTVGVSKDRDQAEERLAAREKRRQRFEIRDLEPAQLNSFRERWRQLQLRFVDDPANAAQDANALVHEVMVRRGYPMDDFEQRAADISVDYPNVVENYRQAHRIAVAATDKTASTEDLRKAFVYYRSLFDELLETSSGERLKETG
jgi:hypothetical protein